MKWLQQALVDANQAIEFEKKEDLHQAIALYNRLIDVFEKNLGGE